MVLVKIRGDKMNLTVKGIDVSIGKKNIVKNISLEAKSGKVTAILGPNGSGKSTILKTIYSTIKQSSGNIYIDNKNIKEYSQKNIAQIMAVVGQFNSMNFDFTVEEIVLMGRNPHLGMFKQESKTDYDIVTDALKKVGMLGFIDRKYQSLSGGEKQRIILARAIAQQPKILILDEPTNHLDIKQQLQVLSIARKLNITVLAALHDLSMTSQFCDYIYFLKDGELKLSGNPRDVINEKNIQDIFDVSCNIYPVENTNKILIDYIS